jgi:hypothetical protein
VKGLSEASAPSVGIRTKAVRHSLTPEDGIADAGGSKAMKARALAVEDDAILVLPNVPAAEGGEGRRRRPLEHAGEGMQLVHVASRARGRADGRPETADKGTPKDDVTGALDRSRANGAVGIRRLDDLLCKEGSAALDPRLDQEPHEEFYLGRGKAFPDKVCERDLDATKRAELVEFRDR